MGHMKVLCFFAFIVMAVAIEKNQTTQSKDIIVRLGEDIPIPPQCLFTVLQFIKLLPHDHPLHMEILAAAQNSHTQKNKNTYKENPQVVGNPFVTKQPKLPLLPVLPTSPLFSPLLLPSPLDVHPFSPEHFQYSHFNRQSDETKPEKVNSNNRDESQSSATKQTSPKNGDRLSQTLTQNDGLRHNLKTENQNLNVIHLPHFRIQQANKIRSSDLQGEFQASPTQPPIVKHVEPHSVLFEETLIPTTEIPHLHIPIKHHERLLDLSQPFHSHEPLKHDEVKETLPAIKISQELVKHVEPHSILFEDTYKTTESPQSLPIKHFSQTHNSHSLHKPHSHVIQNNNAERITSLNQPIKERISPQSHIIPYNYNDEKPEDKTLTNSHIAPNRRNPQSAHELSPNLNNHRDFKSDPFELQTKHGEHQSLHNVGFLKPPQTQTKPHVSLVKQEATLMPHYEKTKSNTHHSSHNGAFLVRPHVARNHGDSKQQLPLSSRPLQNHRSPLVPSLYSVLPTEFYQSLSMPPRRVKGHRYLLPDSRLVPPPPPPLPPHLFF